MRASRSKSADDRPLMIVRGLANRNDRRPVRPCQWRFAERVSQAVLVEQSRQGHAALVARERGGEEPGLAQQAFGSGIEFGGRFERRDEQPLEVFDGLPMATERIIEVQHLADEGRTQMEGRRGAVRDGLVRGGLDQHLALEQGQEAGDCPRPLVQSPVPVAPRQQIRQDNRVDPGTVPERVLLERPSHQLRGRPSRQQDDRRPRGGHIMQWRQARSGGLEGRQAWARDGAGFVGAWSP